MTQGNTKIRLSLLEQNDDQPGSSKIIQIEEQWEKSNSPDDFEAGPTSSNDAIDVPANYCKQISGSTGVRYIQMGHESHIHTDKTWNLEETIRQAEQKFTTDLETITTKTTDDENLLKILVSWEKNRLDQTAEEYKFSRKPKSI